MLSPAASSTAPHSSEPRLVEKWWVPISQRLLEEEGTVEARNDGEEAEIAELLDELGILEREAVTFATKVEAELQVLKDLELQRIDLALYSQKTHMCAQIWTKAIASEFETHASVLPKKSPLPPGATKGAVTKPLALVTAESLAPKATGNKETDTNTLQNRNASIVGENLRRLSLQQVNRASMQATTLDCGTSAYAATASDRLKRRGSASGSRRPTLLEGSDSSGPRRGSASDFGGAPGISNYARKMSSATSSSHQRNSTKSGTASGSTESGAGVGAGYATGTAVPPTTGRTTRGILKKNNEDVVDPSGNHARTTSSTGGLAAPDVSSSTSTSAFFDRGAPLKVLSNEEARQADLELENRNLRKLEKNVVVCTALRSNCQRLLVDEHHMLQVALLEMDSFISAVSTNVCRMREIRDVFQVNIREKKRKILCKQEALASRRRIYEGLL
ncbi:unnamed protein product [Amoebophrya sp. A25]|nr:unnamed protein product [Amoebophrya sp. A25]|eukprot:GSA25T00010100001.1